MPLVWYCVYFPFDTRLFLTLSLPLLNIEGYIPTTETKGLCPYHTKNLASRVLAENLLL